MLEAKAAGEPRKLFDAIHAARTAVKVAPHRASRFDPGCFAAVREKLRIGWRAEVRQNRAVDESVEIPPDHDHPPRSRDRAGNGGRLAQPFGFVTPITKLEWIVERLTVAESNGPSTLSLGLEGHAAIVDEVRLGDCGVAPITWQFKGQRRPCPLSVLDFRNVFFQVGCFVMSIRDTAIPNRRTLGDSECRVLIRNARRRIGSWNDMAI